MIVTLQGDDSYSSRIINLEDVKYGYYSRTDGRATIKFENGDSLYLSAKQFENLMEKIETINKKENKETRL